MAASRPGDRLHRTLLLSTGLILLVGGVAGLIIGKGGFGPAGFRHKPVFDNVVGRYFGRNGAWLWPVVGLAVLIVAFLAFRWLRVQVASPRAKELDLPAERRTGRTLVSPNAVTSALTGEIETYHGVKGASARWLGAARDPGLHLVVTHTHDIDLPALLDRIDNDALAHLRTALDREDVPVRLDLRASAR